MDFLISELGSFVSNILNLVQFYIGQIFFGVFEIEGEGLNGFYLFLIPFGFLVLGGAIGIFGRLLSKK